MKKDVHISITEVTVTSGKTKSFKLKVEGVEVTIPVDEAIFAHYQNQFPRESPTPLQRKRFSTLMQLMGSAYKKGVADGRKS